MALGITLAHNQWPFTKPPLTIEDRGGKVANVVWSPRIGIRVGTEHHWRCAVADSDAVSGRRSI